MMGRAERKVKTRPTVGSVKEEKRSTDFKSPLLLQICHRAERSARGVVVTVCHGVVTACQYPPDRVAYRTSKLTSNIILSIYI
jgi:hypothetical protein